MNNSLNINQIQQNNGLNMQLNNEILKNKELLEENQKLNSKPKKWNNTIKIRITKIFKYKSKFKLNN